MKKKTQEAGGESGIVAGSAKRKINFKLPTKAQTKVILAVIVTVIVAVSLLGFLYIRSKPALVVGSKKISKEYYETLVSQAKESDVLKKAATETIIELEKKKIAAEQLGFLITDNMIREAAAVKYGVFETDKLNEWQLLNGQGMAIDNYLIFAKDGGYHGYAYIFPFTRYIQPSITGSTDPKVGDIPAISENKAYAENKAKSYRDELNTNKEMSEEVVKKILSDSELDYGAAGNDSGEFFFDDSGHSYKQSEHDIRVYDKNIVESTKSLGVGELSEIATLKVQISQSPLAEYRGKEIDGAYYFVQLKNKLERQDAIRQEFQQTLDSIKVEKNV